MIAVEKGSLVDHEVILGADRAGETLEARAVASRRDVCVSEEHTEVPDRARVPRRELAIREDDRRPRKKRSPPTRRLFPQRVEALASGSLGLGPGRLGGIGPAIGRRGGDVESDPTPGPGWAADPRGSIDEGLRGIHRDGECRGTRPRPLGGHDQALLFRGGGRRPGLVLAGVDASVEIDPHVPIWVDPQPERRRRAGRIGDTNHPHALGRDKHLPAASPRRAVGSEREIDLEEAGGDVENMTE